MAKGKNPLLSFGARGSLGDAVSFTRKRGQNIVEKKPIPAYRQTLPQLYQRWDYQDYAALWHTLTATQKRAWASLGSRHHMTGFAYYMGDRLTNLPDLVGRWHLDYQGGVVTPDSSKNNNPGTIVGALPGAGAIEGGLLFDGVDDYVKILHAPVLTSLTAISIECFFYLTGGFGTARALVVKTDGTWAGTDYTLYLYTNNGLYLDTGGHDFVGPSTAITTLYKLYHVIATYDRSTELGVIYIQGELDVTKSSARDFKVTDHDLYIGRAATILSFKGLEDEVRIYNRALLASEAKRHSERRYPL